MAEIKLFVGRGKKDGHQDEKSVVTILSALLEEVEIDLSPAIIEVELRDTYAFVTLDDESRIDGETETLVQRLLALNGKDFMGKPVKIELARERPPKSVPEAKAETKAAPAAETTTPKTEASGGAKAEKKERRPKKERPAETRASVAIIEKGAPVPEAAAEKKAPAEVNWGGVVWELARRGIKAARAVYAAYLTYVAWQGKNDEGRWAAFLVKRASEAGLSLGEFLLSPTDEVGLKEEHPNKALRRLAEAALSKNVALAEGIVEEAHRLKLVDPQVVSQLRLKIRTRREEIQREARAKAEAEAAEAKAEAEAAKAETAKLRAQLEALQAKPSQTTPLEDAAAGASDAETPAKPPEEPPVLH